MTELAYAISSEEHDARSIVDIAKRVEAAGSRSVWISDHDHPWIDRRGQAPFVWSAIGAIGTTTRLNVTTGVTCPTFRIHQAIIAQAAATTSEPARQRTLQPWRWDGEAPTSTSWATAGRPPRCDSTCSPRQSR